MVCAPLNIKRCFIIFFTQRVSWKEDWNLKEQNFCLLSILNVKFFSYIKVQFLSAMIVIMKSCSNDFERIASKSAFLGIGRGHLKEVLEHTRAVFEIQ